MKSIILVTILFIVLSINAWPQSNETPKNLLIFQNIKNNSFYTIKKNKDVKLYLANEQTLKGKLTAINDSFVVIDSQIVYNNDILAVKYLHKGIYYVKEFGVIGTSFCTVTAITGYFIMILAPGELPGDMFDMSDTQFFGYAMLVVGLMDIPFYTPLIFVPYRKFNLQSKWKIVPSIQ